MIYKRNPMLMTVMGMNPGQRRKRPVDDPVDHAIGQAWHRLMSGVQVSVLDIPKIFRDVKLEMAAGMPLEEAVMRVGQRFRVNRNGYRRNPSLAASLAGGMAGAFVTHAMSNPGGPAFVVIDSATGRVVYTKRADGTGDQAIRSCRAVAERKAEEMGRSFIIFMDMGRVRVGDFRSLEMVRALGVTDVIHPRPHDPNFHPTAHDGPASRHNSELCNKCAHEAYCSVCRAAPRQNPGRGQVDENGARELQLYIDNDSRLYHSQFLPIVKNLMKRRAKGVYDREKAAKLFLYLADEGARRYYKEFGSRRIFNLSTRWEVAKSLRDSFEAEAKLGNYDRTTWGVSNNPSKKSSRHTIPQSNPGGRRGGKRKVTMTIEKFAQWVRGKKDPAMWKAFLAKFKGYEKWTHGARARKVTLEWQEVPGMTGLWITYDGGKQPESTYIMPKGSPRKGAWKHPWDTMPDIKHDPSAGVVLTKLRGKSKITDFYHR